MKYIVYNVDCHSDKNYFDTKRGAAISRAALNKKYSARVGQEKRYEYASVEDFENNVVYMREKTNLMTGEKFMERSDTPYYCSPSSETYWSA